MGTRVRKVGNSTQIGRSASSQLGFFGTTPVSQPTNANQAALTDNSGGTASTTLPAISASPTQAEVRNSIASLARLLNQLRGDLVTLGIIKGS